MISLAPQSTDRADGDSINQCRAILGPLGSNPECLAPALQRAATPIRRPESRSRWAMIYASLELGPGRL